MKEIIKDTFIIAFILILGGGYIYQLVLNTAPAYRVATYILEAMLTPDGFLSAIALTVIFSVVAASIIKLSR